MVICRRAKAKMYDKDRRPGSVGSLDTPPELSRAVQVGIFNLIHEDERE